MADKIEFELVSPERLLMSQPVEMVVVPGTEGDFGVLIGHAAMIATVRPGVIDIYEEDRVVERVFVAGGFAEVTPERCTVLAERAVALEEIDRAAAEQEVKFLEEDLEDAKTEIERTEIEKRLSVARALVEASGPGTATAAH
jgi:F-type H+-transporting ATPase subunit epsilon